MTQISVRLDENVKKEAEEACEDIGISLSSAINIFLKKLGREHRIPFEVSGDPFYSETNMNRLRKNKQEMEETGGTIHKVNYNV